MCDMEGLVPALREFLCTTLSAERLSNQAETKRQVLINQLDVVTQPPTLPPRPGDLPPLAPLASGLPSNGDDDFLAQQRALSRQTAPSNGHHDDDPGEMYEDFPGDGDLYEEPCMMEDAEQPRRLSDSGSATSYESYSDFTEDDMDPAYENEQFTPVEDIPLPRIPEEHSITYQTGRKTKKKKKKPSSGDSGVPACRLSGATHRGELSQKGVFSLTKYYCLIHNNMLLCYKSEKDVRPHFKFLLLGYEVLYMEKDGKYSHAIRISHPGCETIMFYADSKEAAQVWCQYMTSASRGLEVAASVDAVEQGHSGDGSVGGGSTSERSGTTLSRTNSGASNRSSGGGPAPPRMATTAPGEETLSGEPSGEGSSRPASPPASLRSKGFSLSNIFSIGRKKGDKVKKQLELENGNSSVTEAGCHGEEETGAFEANAEVRIEGWLKVMDSGKKWYRRWCTIRNNTLECYKEPGEEPHDFCMALRGVTLQNAAKETKKELALRLKSEDRGSLYLEASEAMEHGRWLNVLIKETELSNRVDIDSGYEAPVCSHDMKEAKRPPLPKTMPPIGRRRQRQQGDDDFVSDGDYEDGRVVGNSYQVNSEGNNKVDSDDGGEYYDEVLNETNAFKDKQTNVLTGIRKQDNNQASDGSEDDDYYDDIMIDNSYSPNATTNSSVHRREKNNNLKSDTYYVDLAASPRDGECYDSLVRENNPDLYYLEMSSPAMSKRPKSEVYAEMEAPEGYGEDDEGVQVQGARRCSDTVAGITKGYGEDCNEDSKETSLGSTLEACRGYDLDVEVPDGYGDNGDWSSSNPPGCREDSWRQQLDDEGYRRRQRGDVNSYNAGDSEETWNHVRASSSDNLAHGAATSQSSLTSCKLSTLRSRYEQATGCGGSESGRGDRPSSRSEVRTRVDIFGRVHLIDDKQRMQQENKKGKGRERPSLFTHQSAKRPEDDRVLTPESSAETQVDTAMASIKAKISSAECSEDDKRNISPTPASRQVTGKVRGSLKQNSWVKTSIDAFSPDDDDSITDPNVVRAHKGPTICEDQELLKITSNPLLKELRKERKKSSAWSETELEKLTESIGNLKRNVAQIKKKRAEVRGRKLRATQADERQSLEAELSILDQQLEDAEAELTKANMLKQEKEASLSRSNSQRSSPRLPRNTSISSATCRKSSTLPIKPSDSLDSTNKTNIKNVQNRFTENNNLPNRTGSENKTKSLTLGSSRDNVDGKTVTNRYLPPDRYSSYVTESQEPKNRTNGVSNNKNGIPRNGQNNSTRSDIKSTLLSGGVRSTVGRGSPSSSPVSARSTVGRSTAVAGGSKVGQPQKHIGVQEKLKLWETIGQGKESKA